LSEIQVVFGLVAGLLLLFVLLIAGDLGHHFEVFEFVNKESSHDSVLDLGSVELTTVSSSDSLVADAHNSLLSWSGSLDSLHMWVLSSFLEKVHDEFTTWSFNWSEVVASGSV